MNLRKFSFSIMSPKCASIWMERFWRLKIPCLTLDVGIGFFFPFFPSYADLHDLNAIRILFSIVFIKAPGLMLTAAAVRPSVHLSPLGISIPILAFCPDKEQLPCVKADVIMLLFKGRISHVVILSEISFICSGLPFLMVLKHLIALRFRYRRIDSLQKRQQ